MITKAAIIKQALAMGLVCSTTYVAHKPIEKGVKRATRALQGRTERPVPRKVVAKATPAPCTPAPAAVPVLLPFSIEPDMRPPEIEFVRVPTEAAIWLPPLERRRSMDGISFRPSAPVPEPSTWGMMICGFATCGAMLRVKRAMA